MTEWVHGANAYKNRGCRCPVCTAGNTDRLRAYRRSKGIAPRVIRGRSHGFRSTYTHGGCRCVECRAAEAMYRARYRARQVAS